MEQVKIKKAIEYISKNYKNRITLKIISENSCLSQFHFSRLFKDVIGTSFSHFLRIFRINKAIELLQSKDASISSIAFDAGFGSISTFNNVFKRELGMSPIEYRKEIHSKNSAKQSKKSGGLINALKYSNNTYYLFRSLNMLIDIDDMILSSIVKIAASNNLDLKTLIEQSLTMTFVQNRDDIYGKPPNTVSAISKKIPIDISKKLMEQSGLLIENEINYSTLGKIYLKYLLSNNKYMIKDYNEFYLIFITSDDNFIRKIGQKIKFDSIESCQSFAWVAPFDYDIAYTYLEKETTLVLVRKEI